MYNFNASDLIEMWEQPVFNGKVRLSFLEAPDKGESMINGILREIRFAIQYGVFENPNVPSWVTNVSRHLPPIISTDDIIEIYEKSPLWVHELKKNPSLIENGKIMEYCLYSPLFSLELLDLLRKDESVCEQASKVSKNPILRGRTDAWKKNIALDIAISGENAEVVFSAALLDKSILDLKIGDDIDQLKKCFDIAKNMYEQYESFKSGAIEYDRLNPQYMNNRTFNEVIEDQLLIM